MADTPPAVSAAPKDVKARVLIAFGDHLPNHVITVSASKLKAMKDAGCVDDDATAVAYAEEHEPQPEKSKG